MLSIREDADRYIRNRKFFQELRQRELMGQITRDQRLTLRGQALAGDEEGAQKGLGRLLEAKYEK